MAIIKPRTPGASWGVRLEDPITGDKHNATKKADGSKIATRDEAVIVESEMRLALLKGELRKAVERPEGHAWTIDQWADYWLDHHHGEGTRRPSPTTLGRNRQGIKAFRALHGSKPLAGISRDAARLWAKAHPQQAKSLAAMFNDALDTEKIDRNPFASLHIAVSKGRADIHPLTEDEVALIATIAGKQNGDHGIMWWTYVTVAAWTGLRPGEMCALKWENVDWQNLKIRVDRHVGNRSVEGILGPPKHNRGRGVRMAPVVADALRGLPRDGDFVFRSIRGRPLCPHSLGYWWTPTRAAFLQSVPDDHWLPRRLEIQPDKHLVPYELRHHFGSVLADRQMTARDISIAMGNTEKVCTDRYLHVFEDRHDDRMDAAFGSNVREIRPTDLGQRREAS